MRIILDEGLPRQLAGALSDLGLQTAAFPNAWKGLRNGRLLARVQNEGFDILLSNDSNLYAQQNLAGRAIAIVALPTNWRPVLLARVADIAATIRLARPGDHITIALNGSRRIDNRSPVEGLLLPISPFVPKAL